MAIKEFKNAEEMGKAAAKYISGLIQDQLDINESFTLAVAGGDSPITTYLNLSKEKINWEKVFIFWSDERLVPYENEQSNYKKVNDSLLSKIFIPQKNIYKPPVDSQNAIEAAKVYESRIKNFFNAIDSTDKKSQIPKFDLICLGLGEDGHTASLFPGIKELHKNNKLVVNTIAPDNYVIKDRITFSILLINNAQNVIFIVSGKNKGKVVKEISEGNCDFPAALIEPRKEPIWFIDKTALRG